MKTVKNIRKILLITSVLLVALLLLSACDPPPVRVPETFTFTPGPAFATNINDVEPRRQVKCSVVFEVIDEQAVAELSSHVYVVRDAVIKELGKLTMDELTTEKDLEALAHRLVEHVNEALRSNVDLVTRAFFTDFSVG